MKTIKLTKNYVTVVSNKDYIELSKYKWHAMEGKGKVYAVRTDRTLDKQRKIGMHRQILQIINSKIQADHINGNGLDNRRCNLRVCTQAQNNQNRASKTLRHKGVRLRNDISRTKPYYASINVNGKTKHLGYFVTELEAALAYNKAAKEIHGKFARLNEV